MADLHRLDTKQVAEALHVTPQTVRLHIHAGRLEATKVGKQWLVAESDLARFLLERGVTA